MAVLVPAGATLATEYNYDFVKYPVKAVNDHGYAILNCSDQTCTPTGFGRAFIYHANTYAELTPPRMGAASDVVAIAINNQDQVLLYNHNTATAHVDFFLYDINRDTYRLIGLSGRLLNSPQVQQLRLGPLVGLNDDGEILAGYSGWIHNGDPSGVAPVVGVAYGRPALGVPGSLDAPPEIAGFTQVPRAACATPPRITAFNVHHQFTGSCTLRLGRGADMSSFILSSDAFIEIAVPGAPWTEVNGINNAGVVAGFFQPGKNADRRAFVYDGHRYTTLMQGGSQPPSGAASAFGLNDHGQVAGLVVNVGEHGYIATPSTEMSAASPERPSIAPVLAAPRSPSPPAPLAAAGTSTRSYIGFAASVRDGVLSYADSPQQTHTTTFHGVLPVRAADGAAGPGTWIARDEDRYVMFTLLPSGMVSGTVLPQKIGEQTYEKAQRARNAP